MLVYVLGACCLPIEHALTMGSMMSFPKPVPVAAENAPTQKPASLIESFVVLDNDINGLYRPDSPKLSLQEHAALDGFEIIDHPTSNPQFQSVQTSLGSTPAKAQPSRPLGFWSTKPLSEASVIAKYQKEAGMESVTKLATMYRKLYEGHGIDGAFKTPSEVANWFKNAAMKPDASAKAFYGQILLKGKGIKQDTVGGSNLILEAAALKSPAGLDYGGLMYIYGLGGKQVDFTTGANFFKEASNMGYTPAQVNYAHALRHNEGVPFDYIKAFQLYKLAADKGSLAGKLGMAELMLDGKLENPNLSYDNGLAMLNDLSFKEYLPAILRKASTYASKEDTISRRLAIVSLTQAAGLGDMISQTQLSEIYITGLLRGKPIIAPDLKQAHNWGRKAIEQQSPSQRLDFSQGLFEIEGPEKTLAKIALQSAADGGNVPAMMQMVSMYKEGVVVPENTQMVVKYLKMAAEHNDINALMVLARSFEHGGTNTPKDVNAAFKYYLKAADTGDMEAMLHMEEIYFRGLLNQPRDVSKSISWHLKAQGMPNFAERSDKAHIGIETSKDAQLKKYSEIWDAFDPTVFNSAVSKLKTAAERGNIAAQHEIGQRLLSQGEFKKAIHFFEKADKQGPADF